MEIGKLTQAAKAQQRKQTAAKHRELLCAKAHRDREAGHAKLEKKSLHYQQKVLRKVAQDEAQITELGLRREKRAAHTARSRHRRQEFQKDIERTKMDLARRGGRGGDEDEELTQSWDPLTRILSRRSATATNPYTYHG